AGPPTARVLPTIRAVASSPAPLLLAGIFASYTAQFLSVFGFLPTLLASHYHLGTGTATVLSAVAVTANIPGNTLGGALRGKGAPRWAVISTASIVMAIAEIVIYTPGPALNIRYGACVLLALAGGTIPATLISSAPDFAPRPNTVAATMGALIQGSALGQTLGPPTLAALAAAVGGWQASPVMLGAAAAIAISLSIAVRRIEYRSHHTANRKQRPLPPLIGPRVWTSER
ncbi:MAG: MFS transporter, partial [Pseudonocardiaceae bacterium]